MSKESNTLKQETKIVTAFGPVQLPPEQCHDSVTEEDIVDTLIIDTFETDAEGNVKPVTKQVVTGKRNRKAYIESFSDDVGVENIVKKIATGAIAEDKYSILKTNKEGQVTDLRGFEGINNVGDLESLVLKARATFCKLDPELKKNMTFSEFVSKFDNAALTDYVQKKTVAKLETQKGDNAQ